MENSPQEAKKEKPKSAGGGRRRITFIILSLLSFAGLTWWVVNIPPEGFWRVGAFFLFLFIGFFFAFFSFFSRWKTAVWLSLLPVAFLFLRMEGRSMVLLIFFFLFSWALLKLAP